MNEEEDMQFSQFSAADLLPRLETEFGYRPWLASQIAEKLVASDPRVKKAFWQWWQSGQLDETLDVEGFTAARLVRERGLSAVNAFATLDWLLREPELALTTVNGYDSAIGPRVSDR